MRVTIQEILTEAQTTATRAFAHCHTQRVMVDDLCARLDAIVERGLATAEPEPEVGHDDDTVPVDTAELARRLRVAARERR